MKKLLTTAAVAALLLAAGHAALAVERGGDPDLRPLRRQPVPRSGAQRRQRRHLDPDQPLRHADPADRRRQGPAAGPRDRVEGGGRRQEVTLTLRQGVQFADGKPLTAEDVKWSLDRARNPNNGIWGFLDRIDRHRSRSQDPSHIVLKLKHPDPSILPALATFNTAIMPEKAFEASQGRHGRRQGQAPSPSTRSAPGRSCSRAGSAARP